VLREAGWIVTDVVVVSSLTKWFGNRLAVDHVSFTVRQGEILGLLGPNGAGKSTVVNILTGLIEPDRGEIEIFGYRLSRDRAKVLGRMNIASPYASLPGQLTVRENLSVYAGLYGVPDAAHRIAELLELLGVGDEATTRLSKLSSGQVTRVGLCKALLNRPDLLLLDEPTVYLDTEIAARARSLILRERTERGMTIVLTSHDFTEIERMCDRVVFMDRGRIAAVGTPIEVTRAILGHGRERPALEEAFLRVARCVW
jgi:ABC-2 type transport system ATP-binding protein